MMSNDPIEEFNQASRIDAARGVIKTHGYDPDRFRVEATSEGVRLYDPASGMQGEYPLAEDEEGWLASLDHALSRGDYPKQTTLKPKSP